MLASSEPPVPWRCYLGALENFQHRGQRPPRHPACGQLSGLQLSCPWHSPEPLPGGGSGRSGVGGGEVGYHSAFLGELWPVTGRATMVRIPPKRRFLFASRLKTHKNRGQHRWWGGECREPVRALFFQHSCTFSPPLLLVIRRLLSYFSITRQNTCVCGRAGADSRARRRLWLPPARLHCPALALWILRTLMCAGMGKWGVL